MARLILCLFLATLLFTSCKNGWSNENKDTFYQTCKESASRYTNDSGKIKAFCDCRMEVLMQKYPDENDLLEHMDTAMNDRDLNKCNEILLKK